MIFSTLRELIFNVICFSFLIILTIYLLRKIILKLKFGKLLGEETFLREFLSKDEKILWSEKKTTRIPKLKIISSFIGLLLLILTVFLIIIWIIEELFTSPILSELWLDSILDLIYYFTMGLIFILLLVILVFKRESLSNRVTYYLSNKRVFSSYMRWKDKHIMTFHIGEIIFYDFEKINNSKTNIFNFYFKTTELSDEDIKSSILIFSAKSVLESPYKYTFNLKIDDGWNWNSETNESVIEMKHITDKEGLIIRLNALKIEHKELSPDWKKKYGIHGLSTFY